METASPLKDEPSSNVVTTIFCKNAKETANMVLSKLRTGLHNMKTSYQDTINEDILKKAPRDRTNEDGDAKKSSQAKAHASSKSKHAHKSNSSHSKDVHDEAYNDDVEGITPIEVPADQYEEVLAEIQAQISAGRFKNAKGHTIKDPNTALRMVKKGSVTYKQAYNIAKSGKLDSLAFDIKNSAVSCSCSLGVSFVIGTALGMWRGEKMSNAMRTSFEAAFSSGVTSLVVSVTTNQILRSAVGSMGHTMTQNALQGLYHTNLGKQAIENLASFSLNQTTHGAAAISQVSKLARSNFISAAVTSVVLSTPDLYRAAFKKNISWGQVTKNFGINAVSVAGGTGGWVAGAAAGAMIGTAVPVIGTAVGGLIGGLAGAFAGGTVAGKAAKHIADKVRPDDSATMIELCKEAGIELCDDYCLNEEESAIFIEHVSSLINIHFLRKMFASSKTNEERKAWAYLEFTSAIEDIIENRPKIDINNNLHLLLIDALPYYASA